jgi:hypothetical protein
MNKQGAKLFWTVGRTLFILLVTWSSAVSAASAGKASPNLDDACYAPTLPLTLPLRNAFIDDIKPLAVKAEGDHGVPAAIIAAMSIKESGYGTTKLALAAHNVLSYKWNSNAGPVGRAVFKLTCQPAGDAGNTYIVFKDRADSADFVAGMFESSKYYKQATRDYRDAIANGQNSKSAAIAWLKKIAHSYNPYHTDQYIADVLKIADDPVNQSGKVDKTRTLWRLAPGTHVVPVAASLAGSAPAAPIDSEVAAVAKAQNGAYAISGSTNHCPLIDASKLGWQSAPVQECIYQPDSKNRQLTAYVLLLSIKPEAIASWIKTGCAQELPGVSNCFDTVLRCGSHNSGMMFPVSGNLMENMENEPWKNYFFRNGMTVNMTNRANGDGKQIPMDVQKQLAMLPDDQVTDMPTGLTRLWRTTPAQFAARYHDDSVPKKVKSTTAAARQKWLDVARSEMLAAMDGTENRLLDAWIHAHPKTLSVGSCPGDSSP